MNYRWIIFPQMEHVHRRNFTYLDMVFYLRMPSKSFWRNNFGCAVVPTLRAWLAGAESMAGKEGSDISLSAWFVSSRGELQAADWPLRFQLRTLGANDRRRNYIDSELCEFVTPERLIQMSRIVAESGAVNKLFQNIAEVCGQEIPFRGIIWGSIGFNNPVSTGKGERINGSGDR